MSTAARTVPPPHPRPLNNPNWYLLIAADGKQSVTLRGFLDIILVTQSLQPSFYLIETRRRCFTSHFFVFWENLGYIWDAGSDVPNVHLYWIRNMGAIIREYIWSLYSMFISDNFEKHVVTEKSVFCNLWIMRFCSVCVKVGQCRKLKGRKLIPLKCILKENTTKRMNTWVLDKIQLNSP